VSADLIPPPYGAAVCGRGLRIVRQIEERTSSAVFSAKDISAARWVYRIRAYTSDAATTFTYNEVITKGSASSTGWLDHYLSLGDTAYDSLIWEVVEIDTSNADATTETGYREAVLERWKQPVVDAP
jgi:hypothetical protein